MDFSPLRTQIARLSPRSADDVRIAVLDGPVDTSHPCFSGADLRTVDSLVPNVPGPGAMSLHGTHVASLIFGQPGSAVPGMSPESSGLIVPVFRDDAQRLSQLDLARAIEIAVREGADVINISGGERTPTGEPDEILARALQLCEDEGVVVVAAVGNDGADCVQVPAAVPTVLAVGASTNDGEPLRTNNWGETYCAHGVLAPGQEIPGARAGGGVIALTGSSFAVPAVSSAVAALIAAARRRGAPAKPSTIRQALCGAATGRDPPDQGKRFLGGFLDVDRSNELLTEREKTMDTRDLAPPGAAAGHPGVEALIGIGMEPGVLAACAEPDAPVPVSAAAVPPIPQHIYAICTIGWDFGTEARRDGFVQQMDLAKGRDGSLQPANPYDPHQLSQYLAENPWASDKVIWTCNLEGRTPIYALEAEIPYGMAWGGPSPADNGKSGQGPGYPPVSIVHRTFREAIVGQAQAPGSSNRVTRVSVPGTVTNRTVRLFSGQVVPVVVTHAQGLYTWNESVLLDTLVEQVNADRDLRKVGAVDPAHLRLLVRAFLDKVYFQFRNLGMSGPDRALNYAATNAFELTVALVSGFLSARMVPRQSGESEPLYALDDITVARSRFSRPDGESYDVTLTFMDPENDRRSRVAYLLTVDVSTSPPVSLAPIRQFLIR